MIAPRGRRSSIALFDTTDEASLLDVLDSLLNKGIMATGDVVLGVAGVDLIYLRLSTLVSAVDRVTRRRARKALPARRRRRR